jgi:hypothetical protein
MDVQIKIKILKNFVDELQKPFYKTKKRDLSKPLVHEFSPLLKKKKI